TTGTVDRKDLLAPPGRALEDAPVPQLHDVKPSARLAFAEDQFASAVIALHKVRDQKGKLLLRQAGEDGNAFQHRERGGFLACGHGDDFTRCRAAESRTCRTGTAAHLQRSASIRGWCALVGCEVRRTLSVHPRRGG